MDPIDERLIRAGAAWRDTQPPLGPMDAEPERTVRWWRRSALVPAVAMVVVVVVAVGVLWAVSPRGAFEVASSPSPRSVALLMEGRPAETCLLVRIAGRLVREPESGLGITRADGVTVPVRWPFGFSAYERAGRVVLVDDAGAPVAIDGDPVGFGSAGKSGGIQTACRPSLDADRPWPGSPAVGNLTRPFAQEELVALARQRGRGNRTPDIVVASVAIPRAIEDDGSPAAAIVGMLGEEDEVVFFTADPAQAASLPPDDPLTGTFAVAVEPEALRLLGPVDLGAGGSLLQEITDVAAMTAGQRDPFVAVDGWLSVSLRRCPATVPQPSAGPDLPSWGCGTVQITDEPTRPSAAIAVQDGAWTAFGEIPGLDVRLPRHGVYLLRREEAAPGAGSGGAWSLVARLERFDTVTLPLPAVFSWNGACRGVGLGDSRLTGDPSDPRVVWLVDETGERRDVIWPPGYTARFGPLLEVRDEGGVVVFREGDHPAGACVTGPDAQGPLLIGRGIS